MSSSSSFDYDYIVIGSGFGGSISALRLSEKGYRVLVLEKGKRFASKDFPKTNWNLRRWFWLPSLKFHGHFRLTFLRHVTILSGVGVGGGSLVYANTLPVPKQEFFRASSWSHLADWEAELKEYYPVCLKMLGATPNPNLQIGDRALKTLAQELGKEEHFEATNVAVFFGEPEVTVPDPFFGGKGPERAGCTFCGGCMVGCRYNAKNTLDKNYLYLAEQNGVTVQAESEVDDVAPIGRDNGSEGYRVRWRTSTRWFNKKRGEIRCRGVIFAGGVLGTVPLLLKLKNGSLPRLSERIGFGVRTNSESLMGAMALDGETDFSKGVAIGSILHTDEHSHLEPVRYSAGSGFWRLAIAPMVPGNTLLSRLWNLVKDLVLHPVKNFRAFFVDDWAKRAQILLYMRTIDSHLRFSAGGFGLRSSVEKGKNPTAFMPEAYDLGQRYAKIVNGKATVLFTETLLGIPTTAHILGGCVMGKDASEGVIDKDNRVFGYENMMVCDGSMISSNPGVNPSLTIAALTERAMGKLQTCD